MRPITAAACSAAFSGSSSTSMREASTAWTDSGISKPGSRSALGGESERRGVETVAGDERVEVPGHVETECEPENLPGAELAAYLFRRIAFEDPEVLLQHLRQRPVRDPLSVGETPSGPAQRLRLELREVFPQLAHESCLPDARVARD